MIWKLPYSDIKCCSLQPMWGRLKSDMKYWIHNDDYSTSRFHLGLCISTPIATRSKGWWYANCNLKTNVARYENTYWYLFDLLNDDIMLSRFDLVWRLWLANLAVAVTVLGELKLWKPPSQKLNKKFAGCLWVTFDDLRDVFLYLPYCSKR